ncbi:MAG: reverse transcriptase domain-containing protein, partial [Bacteroidota bacterium]
GGPTDRQAPPMQMRRGSLATPMTGAGQSLRDPCILNAEGPPSPSPYFGVGQGGANATPAQRTRPGFNLRRVLRVGSWNVLSLSDDHRLPYLSSELRRLRVDIVGLSETRRPGRGEISSGGYSYYWSGMEDGSRLRGVAVGISSRLQPFVVEVTPVDERMMRVRMKHTLGFISLIAVYAPTEVCKAEEKEMFYAKLNSILDQCPPRDTLVVLGDFNATTGADRAGYELCVGPHGSGTRNNNSSRLLDLARSRRLRIAGSWYQRPELHRWTWYSNAGGVAKEIDHILVSTRWRILQNCRVFRSAEFFATDHRLVVATLKLHVKSRRIPRCNDTAFHLEKLKDPTCAHEYAVTVSNRFNVLSTLEDPVELWDTFKRETLEAAKECIGERPRSRGGFVSEEALANIEESRAARLTGSRDQYRALSRRTRALLRRDKERYVRSLAEDVESHLNANDLRPAYRALKKLRSKPTSRVSSVRKADGCLVSDMDGQRTRWAEYFEQLYTVDPPSEQLRTDGLRAVDADPPIDEAPPSLDEVREAVARLRGGKAAGVCSISAELLKAGGEAVTRGLHAVLTAVWQSGTIPPDWKRGLVVPIWKGKGDRQDCNNYRGITLLSVPGKVFAHLLLMRIRSQLLKLQRPEQSGFTPGKSTTDRILALRVLVERRREFRQGMLAAYVDLKKAFDSVHREALWDLLRLRGIPARIIDLLTGLYSGTESAVKCGGGASGFFPVNTGVRQGCVLAPSLFNTC